MTEEIRILIIDDEASIRNILKINLVSQGYSVAESASGAQGQKLATEFHPHLIILDLGLPDKNGYEVLKEFRAWTRVPIIILTVNDDEQVKVKLLDTGADDYLTKPFGPNELLARVRVCLRNHSKLEATPIFKSDDLEIDLSLKKVCVDGVQVKLTNTEFEVLARLVRDQGKVVTQTLLLKQIWGSAADEQSQYLRIYINQLRKKIEKDTSKPKHILTESGVGYRLV